MCSECYERKCLNIEDVVLGVCKIPHLVLWAKLENYPYWPAKELALKGDMVEVLFFGQHETAMVPYTNCMLFSEEHPNHENVHKYRKDFDASFKVNGFSFSFHSFCKIELKILTGSVSIH